MERTTKLLYILISYEWFAILKILKNLDMIIVNIDMINGLYVIYMFIWEKPYIKDLDYKLIYTSLLFHFATNIILQTFYVLGLYWAG